MSSSRKRRFAIVGATGLVGFPIARAGLLAGHTVVCVSRGRSERNAHVLDELALLGAQLVFTPLDDAAALTRAFAGADVVISLIHGTSAVIGEREGVMLTAAVAAGVGRFIPCEFGINTLAAPMGAGLLFDEKKKFHAVVRASGIPYTLIYPGLIFDYSLPNLREYDAITTFGDLQCRFPVTHRDDIGAVTIRASLDPRCVNKAVQIAENWVCQAQFMPLLSKHWPQHKFDRVEHVDTATVLRLAEQGALVDPNGEVPERERFQINRACYVDGIVAGTVEHCDAISNWQQDTLDARTLYPDIKFRTIDDALSDPAFVFK